MFSVRVIGTEKENKVGRPLKEHAWGEGSCSLWRREGMVIKTAARGGQPSCMNQSWP